MGRKTHGSPVDSRAAEISIIFQAPGFFFTVKVKTGKGRVKNGELDLKSGFDAAPVRNGQAAF